MCERVIQLNDKGERLRRSLIVIMIIYTAFLIIRIVFGTINLCLLFILIEILFISGIILCHFLCLSFLMLHLMYDLVNSFLFIGIKIQCYFFIKENSNQLGLIIEGVSLLFVGIIIHFVFQAYREFKFIYVGNTNYRKLSHLIY